MPGLAGVFPQNLANEEIKLVQDQEFMGLHPFSSIRNATLIDALWQAAYGKLGAGCATRYNVFQYGYPGHIDQLNPLFRLKR